MLVEFFPDYEALSVRAAQRVADLIRRKPDAVIGFATGSTPLGLYRELVRMHKETGLDFSKMTTFNLDEYVGLPPNHPQSYHYFMFDNLFSHINVSPARVYIPHSQPENIEEFCVWYEKQIVKAGGIDLQILGIGGNGHMAFNEPGSSLGSRTRIKTLTATTVRDNARFFERGEDVPKFAVTMGIGTIMEARQLLLLASGSSKAEAIRRTLEGPITAMCPSTIVQLHPQAHVLVDSDAASRLEYEHRSGISEPKASAD